MNFLIILKLFGFLLWPILLLLPYFVFDREHFKKRFKEIVSPTDDSKKKE
ncbi:MAG: hypothetical protein Q9M50_07415 [Methylococcales bacterium]|nr:hypothetical protein [Methylococcales bacterium]